MTRLEQALRNGLEAPFKVVSVHHPEDTATCLVRHHGRYMILSQVSAAGRSVPTVLSSSAAPRRSAERFYCRAHNAIAFKPRPDDGRKKGTAS